MVTDKDLFVPDRMELAEAENTVSTAEPEPEPEPEPLNESLRIAGRKIILYGIVIAEDYKTALISNPKSKNPGRPSMWVEEGDAIGDDGQVLVSSIQKEGISLRKAEKVYQIPLYEMDKPRGRVAAPKQASPTVVATESPLTSESTMAVPKFTSKPIASQKSPKGDEGDEGDEGSKSKKGELKTLDTPFGKVKVRKE